jgi:hypothetical protein
MWGVPCNRRQATTRSPLLVAPGHAPVVAVSPVASVAARDTGILKTSSAAPHPGPALGTQGIWQPVRVGFATSWSTFGDLLNGSPNRGNEG